MTAGGLGEFETAGVQMNIVPKQGGSNLSGLFARSGFSKGMQSDNYSSDLQARGAGRRTGGLKWALRSNAAARRPAPPGHNSDVAT
jgi:hypothetical protein